MIQALLVGLLEEDERWLACPPQNDEETLEESAVVVLCNKAHKIRRINPPPRRRATPALRCAMRRPFVRFFFETRGTRRPFMSNWAKWHYHSSPKLYCVNFGEFTVFLEAGDENKTRDLEPCT